MDIRIASRIIHASTVQAPLVIGSLCLIANFDVGFEREEKKHRQPGKSGLKYMQPEVSP